MLKQIILIRLKPLYVLKIKEESLVIVKEIVTLDVNNHLRPFSRLQIKRNTQRINIFSISEKNKILILIRYIKSYQIHFV